MLQDLISWPPSTNNSRFSVCKSGTKKTCASTLFWFAKVPLKQWLNGLSVMLEKTLGVQLVSKLRPFLLLETDFNATNKVVFGDHMLQNTRKHKEIPEEIFSDKKIILSMTVVLIRHSSMT